MLNTITEKGLMPDATWEITVDSSVEGVSKPIERIFEIVKKRAGVNPEHILFIENSQRLLDAAQKRG